MTSLHQQSHCILCVEIHSTHDKQSNLLHCNSTKAQSFQLAFNSVGSRSSNHHINDSNRVQPCKGSIQKPHIMVSSLTQSFSLTVIVLSAKSDSFHSRRLKIPYRSLHHTNNSLSNQIEFVLWIGYRNAGDGAD